MEADDGEDRVMADLFRWIVLGYQRMISPILPPVCRFHPSCSQYAVESLRIHGPWKGSALSARRIARCNPFFAGGMDPVPEGDARGE